MAIQKTEAIVLRTTKLRETSYIVTFFSQDYGKFQAVTKGVRQPGSPWAGLYEPMNRLEVIFYEKFRSDIHLATEATGLDLRMKLRRDFKTLVCGYYLTEILESFSNVGEPDPAYWQLMEEAYHFLPEAPLLVTLIFELKFLNHSGFLPDLEVMAGKEGEEGLTSYLTSFVRGAQKQGAMTTTFIEKGPPVQSPHLYKNFRYLLHEDWQKAFRLRLNPEEIQKAEAFTGWLVAAKLERKIRSRRFLEELYPSQSI